MYSFIGIKPNGGYSCREVKEQYVDMVAVHEAAKKLNPWEEISINKLRGKNRAGLLLYIPARTATSKEKRMGVFRDIQAMARDMFDEVGMQTRPRLSRVVWTNDQTSGPAETILRGKPDWAGLWHITGHDNRKRKDAVGRTPRRAVSEEYEPESDEDKDRCRIMDCVPSNDGNGRNIWTVVAAEALPGGRSQVHGGVGGDTCGCRPHHSAAPQRAKQ